MRRERLLVLAGAAAMLLGCDSSSLPLPPDVRPWLEAGLDQRGDGASPFDGLPPGDGGPADSATPGDAKRSDGHGDGRRDGRTDGQSTTGLAHPFGAHSGYFGQGVIVPNNHTPVELDKATTDFYAKWKSLYLRKGCAADQMYVKTNPATDDWTVSEGHGYGMLISVIMAGHDPDAHPTFDALYRYYDAHRSVVDSDLMGWAQDSSCKNVDDADSATDGDLDIAYSLLLAARQWGNAGTIKYSTEASRIIAAILKSDIHPQNSVLVGDWASDPSDSHHNGTRPSDFATSHFKAFNKATGVARWNDVVTKTYQVIGYLQSHYASATGLLPDFAVNASGGAPSPAPAGWMEGPHDGTYGWNACRAPWRIATDYLMSGEPRAQSAIRLLNSWIRTKTSNDPTKIVDGYQLSGTPTGTTPEVAFVAPFTVAAMVEPSSGTNQAWLNALWDWLVSEPASDYYGDSLRLLAMIVVSRNWWVP